MSKPEQEPMRVKVLHCLDCPALRVCTISERCGLMQLGPSYNTCKALPESAWHREPPPDWCPLRTRPVLVVLADSTQ